MVPEVGASMRPASIQPLSALVVECAREPQRPTSGRPTHGWAIGEPVSLVSSRIHMNSVVCWLDLSPEDMRRAGEFLEVMQGHGTKDELGFLAMQRAFANRFYPATTTQLSLARYFYFLPAIYESLERQHVSSAQSRRFIRDRQEELRRALKENDGIRYRERAVTLPSDVYWSALGALGFPRSPGWSEAGYLGALDAAYRGNRPWHDDDKVTRTGRTLGFWDPDRPDS